MYPARYTFAERVPYHYTSVTAWVVAQGAKLALPLLILTNTTVYANRFWLLMEDR
jgi:hypothetical protein